MLITISSQIQYQTALHELNEKFKKDTFLDSFTNSCMYREWQSIILWPIVLRKSLKSEGPSPEVPCQECMYDSGALTQIVVMEENLTEYCLKISAVVDQMYKHNYTVSGFYGRS